MIIRCNPFTSRATATTLIPRRQFSLFSSPPLPPPSLPLPLPPPAPPPPTLIPLDLLPHTSYFDPLATLFLTIPLPPALLIPLLTIFFRSTFTLPLIVWQRGRVQRFQEVVLPLVREAQEKLRWDLRKEWRARGEGYESYQKEFAERAKKLVSTISSQQSLSPYLTMYLPPLIHIPIFISGTLALRAACDLSLLPTDNFHALASDSFLWCPSLVLPDPTMGLPLLVGLIQLLNVELGQEHRREMVRLTDELKVSMQSERDRKKVLEPVTKVAVQKGVKRFLSTTAVGGRGEQTSRAEKSKLKKLELVANAEVEVKEPELVEREKGAGVTLFLRIVSIVFIPVAAFAPSAICLYWLSSGTFSLIQNLIFNSVDKKKRKHLGKDLKTT